MSLLLIDRYHPALRREQQAAIDAGQLELRDELTLLEPAQLWPLAKLGLWLLAVGGLFFGALDGLVYGWQMHAFPSGISWWSVVLWLIINILGYFIVLPVHEAIHACAFVFWGGKPHVGAKLPLALYCGAKDQLFRRNQYLVVGLAPLVVISILAIIVTLLSPVLASYTLLATSGNFSGAVGDIWAVARLLRLPPAVLIEDTETGYRAWEVRAG